MANNEDFAIQDEMHPIDECTNRIRQAIKDAIKKMNPQELNDLFAAIGEQIQDIEKGAKRK